MTDKITTARAGDTVSPKAMKRLFGHMHEAVRASIPTKVQPKSDAKHGQWVCIDCGESFDNNMMAGSHTPAKHRRAWWTGEHMEEP